MSEKLTSFREKIDKIDNEMLFLLNERAKIAIQVGKEKEKEKIKKRSHFHVPEREREIYDRLTEINNGPFPNGSIKAIYREIISATLSLEKPLQIAYLGPEATFTHLAGFQHFGHSADFIAVKSIKDVFLEVERKRADYGVVPIENSIEGVVNHTLDMFVDSTLNICAEIFLEISHNLLSQTRDLKKIKKVYSHPHAIAQCRNWLESKIPNAVYLEVESTAKAAKFAAGDETIGAIASESAALLYNLKVAAKDIQDTVFNYTRFLVIGSQKEKKTGADKTSLLFSLKDQAGALFLVLEPFVKHKINMTKIESRPLKKKAWQYVFFVDIEGHCDDEKISVALDELENKSLYLKVLGSYPKCK